MTGIRDKVAVITGGASGIGLGLAEIFGLAGARIVIADVEPQALERASGKLAEHGVDADPVVLDVTDRSAFVQARDRIIAKHGAVHLLFNNAGVNVPGPLYQVGFTDWDWVLGVNLGGVINGLTTFLPELMSHRDQAHIVNTASVGGLVGMRGLGIYNASKFAVVGLSEALRADLQSTGVGVSVLCPGVVATALGNSERNRPARLGGTGNSALAADTAASALGLSPLVLAQQVMAAVESNRFFVSSHPEFRDLVGQRNAAVQRSFTGEADSASVQAMSALIEPFANDSF